MFNFQIEFAYPELFILLIMPLFIIWLAPVYKEQRSSMMVPYFKGLVQITGLQPQTGAVMPMRNHVQRIMLGLTWLCVVISMAKPELIGAAITQQKSARDLMVAVDLSGSMAVEDFKVGNAKPVSRIKAVKAVLNTFAKNRAHDRLGLILFADAAYLQAPFTDDITAWSQLLNEAQIGMAGQSTAFGDAIGLAISIFEKSKTQKRVLIVLTDGNDTHSSVVPVDAAKIAATKEIKIYTIAIGDPEAVGEEKVELSILADIAKLTGGQSFTALDSQELQKVYDQIDALEPELFDLQSFRPRESLHQYPIMLIALLYMTAFAIVICRAYIKRLSERSIT